MNIKILNSGFTVGRVGTGFENFLFDECGVCSLGIELASTQVRIKIFKPLRRPHKILFV